MCMLLCKSNLYSLCMMYDISTILGAKLILLEVMPLSILLFVATPFYFLQEN